MLRIEFRDAIRRQVDRLNDLLLVTNYLAKTEIEWSVVYRKPIPGAENRAKAIELDLLQAKTHLKAALTCLARVKATVGE